MVLASAMQAGIQVSQTTMCTAATPSKERYQLQNFPDEILVAIIKQMDGISAVIVALSCHRFYHLVPQIVRHDALILAYHQSLYGSPGLRSICLHQKTFCETWHEVQENRTSVSFSHNIRLATSNGDLVGVAKLKKQQEYATESIRMTDCVCDTSEPYYFPRVLLLRQLRKWTPDTYELCYYARKYVLRASHEHGEEDGEYCESYKQSSVYWARHVHTPEREGECLLHILNHMLGTSKASWLPRKSEVIGPYMGAHWQRLRGLPVATT